MRQVLSTELTARHLPHPRDLRTSLDRRRMREADNDVGICSPGHGQATHAGTRGTLGSSQHLLRQHLLHSCICFPQVCIARICCAGALRGLQVATRRSPGWLELALASLAFPAQVPVDIVAVALRL